MKTILVPTDFSSCAQQAMVAAVQFAENTGAEIVLMHTIVAETVPSLSHFKHPEFSKPHREVLRKLIDVAGGFVFKKVKIHKQIAYGIPYEEILKTANRIQADLIIMGTHENESLDKPFIGSTAQKVFRESTCPVLMIKKKFVLGHWRKIAVACDLNTGIQKPFEKIKNLAKALNATIHLIYINRPTDFMDKKLINDKMEAIISQHQGVNFVKVIYDYPEIAQGVLQYAKENNIDWTAIITRNHIGKPQYLIGNTEILAFRSFIPVMSVKTTYESLSMS